MDAVRILSGQLLTLLTVWHEGEQRRNQYRFGMGKTWEMENFFSTGRRVKVDPDFEE
jgi:hypothetical protein